MSKRRYYVIHEDGQWKIKLDEDGQWKIKLENGPVLSTHGSDRRDAIDEAKRLGGNNNRPVMVNYKDGRTGAVYYDETDL